MKGVGIMFFKILKRDIKRKKAMNIILFIFMIIASILIAGSVNMLYASTTALEHFKRVSNLADNIIVTSSNEENDREMEEWIQSSDMIQGYNIDNTIFVTASNLIIPAQYGNLKDDTTLILSKVPTDYNLIFNQKNEFLKLMQGEVALPLLIATNYGIKIGDKITVQIEDVKKELVVQYFTKDVTFGSAFMGFKRIILSDADFKDLEELKNTIIIKIWSLNKREEVSYIEVEKDFNKRTIDSIATFNNDLISFSYILDTILAVIMIIASLFLIFIAFLIIKFTILFTIEEDYKEIGIMKAIGMKNRSIKKIYMVKYLAIAILGGSIGFIFSIPFADYLIKSISARIIIQSTFFNYILSIMSVIFIIIITIGFCSLSARRINQLSAIDAIRQGSNGERFSSSRKLKLHKLKSINLSTFLAISDLVSGFRKFIILNITFILGTAIIIIPINIINTLNSNEFLTLFGLSNFDFNIGSNNYIGTYMDGSIEKLLSGINELEHQMNEAGVSTEIYPDVNFVTRIYVDSKENSKNVFSLQSLDYSAENYTYLTGSAPKLTNEIAITTVVAEYYDVDLGDTIYCNINDQTRSYIITGLYQSMNNLGYSVRFSEVHPLELNETNGFSLFGIIEGSNIKQAEAIRILKDNFPELDIKTNEEYKDALLGSIVTQVGTIKNLILGLVLGINFLITSLLVRMLIAKEVPEIAILKSIGFQDKAIRSWQIRRIAILLIISIFLGTIFANVTDTFFTSGIFRGMGITHLSLTIKPLQVYIIYPVILLIVTMSAVLISLSKVKKTQIWVINNQE
jgi:putative ABC transport system permease protein